MGGLGYYIASKGMPVGPFVAIIAASFSGVLLLVDGSRSVALADAEPDPAVALRGSMTYRAGAIRRVVAAGLVGFAVFQYAHNVVIAVLAAIGVALLAWGVLYLILRSRLARVGASSADQ